MTEQQYLSWTSPTAILKCLGPRMTRHQYLLFLAASWRQVVELDGGRLREEEIRLVEKVSLDEASAQSLRAAGAHRTAERVEEVLNDPSFEPAWFTGLVSLLGSWTPEEKRAKQLTHVNLLRCIGGNPYTPTGADPAWLRWDRGAIPRLAEAIHQERRFDELPVLADALEEAGCDDSDILGHCRTRREHALGCWVLALLRAKLSVRLVLSEPEARLSGWRPDTVELENVSAAPVTLDYLRQPFERLSLLTLDEAGEVAIFQRAVFADEAWTPTQPITLSPGETLSCRLGPMRSLKPGIYTMQALLRHGGIDLRSRAFLFTVHSQA